MPSQTQQLSLFPLFARPIRRFDMWNTSVTNQPNQNRASGEKHVTTGVTGDAVAHWPFCSSRYTPSRMASGGISLLFIIDAAWWWQHKLNYYWTVGTLTALSFLMKMFTYSMSVGYTHNYSIKETGRIRCFWTVTVSKMNFKKALIHLSSIKCSKNNQQPVWSTSSLKCDRPRFLNVSLFSP